MKEITCKFLIEIPDFGGNSRRNHPEPEGNFQKFPEGEGDFCEFPTQNQEFKINSGFYISSTVSKCKSHLCRPAGVRVFSTRVRIHVNQSSTRDNVQNTILTINNPTNMLQVSKITNSSRFVQNTILHYQQFN